MTDALQCGEFIVFSSKLGWMCLRMQGKVVCQLTFGHTSAAAAIRAIGWGRIAIQKPTRWQQKVVENLRRYAEGAPVDFCDLAIDSGKVTEFQARVLRACRKIAYGETITYGELAATAGAGRWPGRGAGHVRQPPAIDHSLPSRRAKRG